ncbi:hypothetical protein FHW12_000350 [Dokdonella fugitiva]|uniref:Phage virion morphogenesis protein n=1 Tax=Dokdonella fugitiva TaxID=328517 RepID=A0A839EWS0_9GAMM|nr:phage virion morphogenesis protein [Dokdonella fugitiva]MBA8886159.1 hypothetical protein [Dokdonella fugitiva]
MSVRIDIDSAAAQRQYDALRQLAENPQRPLELARDVLEQRVRQTFRDEADPWGSPWAPHSPVTTGLRARRGNTRVSLLIDTGKMFSTIRSGVEGNEAFVAIGGEGTFPEVHQRGNPDNKAWGRGRAPIPARPMFPLRGDEVELPDAWANDLFAPFDEAIAEALA